MDSKLQVDVVYTDLSKAFDRVHHCALLNKLKYYGLCDSLLLLFKSILIDRTQYVEYRGFASSGYLVGSGVVQGSNLGPLLFVVFYNDVVCSLSCRPFIYADDLKIATVVRGVDDCLELQRDLDMLTQWCQKNLLDINISKCKTMSFTRNNNKITYFYNINGHVLERCTQVSDLGVIFDSSLTFVPHILHITNSAMKTLGFIFRNTREFTNISSLKLLFYSLVRSRLEYCSVVWKPYYQVYINLIENIVRKFAKYVFFKMFNMYPVRHCNQMQLLEVIGESSLVSRRNMHCLIFLQKILNGSVNSHILLKEIFIICPRRSSRSQNTFYYCTPSTYHHLNSPLLYSFRLYNEINLSFDIFYSNFSGNSVKKAIINFLDARLHAL